MIELMIVVIIIAIMAAIGYPSYQQHVRKTRRADAQTGLTQMANLQQRFFTECNRYATNLAGTTWRCDNASSVWTLGKSTASPEGFYTFALSGGIPGSAACGAGDFTCGFSIIATPQGQQAPDQYLFYIDSTGRKRYDANKNGSFDAGEEGWHVK